MVTLAKAISAVMRAKTRVERIGKLMGNRDGRQWFFQNFVVKGKRVIGWLGRNLEVEKLRVDLLGLIG